MGRRCQITISTGTLYPGGAVTDWPRIVRRETLPDEMFDADGAHPALSDGGDVWASLDGTVATQIPLDLVFFSTDNDPANGTAEIVVKIPGSSTASIYVHWGGAQTAQPARNTTYGGDAVWSNSFGAVYRFWDVPGATLLDRSGNGRTLTIGGSGQTQQTTPVAGILGPHWTFGASAMQTNTAWLGDTTGAYTITAQVVCGGDDDNEKVFAESQLGFTGGNFIYAYRSAGLDNTPVLYVKGSGSEASVLGGNTIPSDTPVLLDFIRDTANLEIRVDGVSVASNSSAGSLPATYPTVYGGVACDDQPAQGQGWRQRVSMVTVATVARDLAWTRAWKRMLSDTATGLTVGTPEDEPVISNFKPWMIRRGRLMGRGLRV